MLNKNQHKAKLQYTRIGLPFSDLNEIFTNTNNNKEIVSKILEWIVWEYHAVKKLIK